MIRKMSERSLGIGSDGLVLIKWNSSNNMAEMRMFNADGSEAKMCGNALRCIGRYLFEKNGTSQANVLTGGGIHRLAKIHSEDSYLVQVGIQASNCRKSQQISISQHLINLDSIQD